MKIFSSDLEDEINISEKTLLEKDVLDSFYNLYDENGSFWGIKDDDENILQFYWLHDDTWLVDIPVPPDFINYQKKANYEECISIIKNILKNKKIHILSGMIKVDTMKTTLYKDLEKLI